MRAISSWKSAHLLWALLLVFAAAAPVWAAEDDDDNPAKEDLIAEALDHRVTVDVNGAALADILGYFADLLPADQKISIVIDRRKIEEEGIDLGRPVSLKVNDIRLRSALNLILTDAGLDWTVRDEVLLITTKDEAAANTVTRVYDVDELVVQKGDDDRTPHFDELIELIQNEVAPDSWADAGGPGAVHPFSVNGGRLVVRQTPQAHYAIAKLLEELSSTAHEPAEQPKADDDKTPSNEKSSDAKSPAADKDEDEKADGKKSVSVDGKPMTSEEMLCPRTKR
jgi:hypothetical protein